LAADHPTIIDVRGRGLMIGVECLDTHAAEIVNACRDQGLLVNVAGGATVRFVPPLIVTAQDVESAVSRVKQALEEWTSKQAA